LYVLKSIKVHSTLDIRDDKGIQDVIADTSGQDRDGTAPGDDSEKIIPSTTDTTTMSFYEVFQWN